MSLIITSSEFGYESVDEERDIQKCPISACWQWRHVEKGAIFLAIASLVSTVYFISKLPFNNSVPAHNPVMPLTTTLKAPNPEATEANLGYAVGAGVSLLMTIFSCAIASLACEKKEIAEPGNSGLN